jgi:hypothetical protein
MTTDAPAQRTPVRDPRYLALRNFAISMSAFIRGRMRHVQPEAVPA